MVRELMPRDTKTDSFKLDEGVGEIKERRTAVGYEEVIEYPNEIAKGDLLTISASGDEMAKKAASGDILLGRLVEKPKPDITAEHAEGEVELFGLIKYLPLKEANIAIAPKDPIAVGVDGADKGTEDSPFIALQTASANDDLEILKVFLPFAGKLVAEEEG